jgi:hypothetical protein
MYTIYEIPGVKIGCDYDWPTRAKEQCVDPETCIVLQQESDLIQVSIDEMWWQIEKGYPVDSRPYFEVVEMNRKRAPKGGKVGGKKNVESGHWQSIKSEGGKVSGPKNGKKNVESGEWKKRQIAGGKCLWIYRDGIQTRVPPEKLQRYLDDGWTRGRIRNK